MEQKTLKETRRELKMTQGEVAEKMGVSIAAVSAWETNKADLPTRQFVKLCDIYNASRDSIFLPTLSN